MYISRKQWHEANQSGDGVGDLGLLGVGGGVAKARSTGSGTARTTEYWGAERGAMRQVGAMRPRAGTGAVASA
jgi:hypothetical protein